MDKKLLKNKYFNLLYYNPCSYGHNINYFN